MRLIFNLLLFNLSYFAVAGWIRSLIADYGVPLMVLVFTAISYAPYSSVPKGIPRRLVSPNPWSRGAYQNWTVIKVYILFFHFYYMFCSIFNFAFDTK